MSANNYSRLAANNAGIQIFTGSLTLVGLSINTKGAAANVLTLYDGTSTGGALLGIFDTTVNTGMWLLGYQVRTGLFAVLATGTPADITFVFG